MTDVAEPREVSDCSTQRTGRGVAIFLSILAIYVESPVPIGWLLNKTEMWPVAFSVFAFVFAPLEFLYEHFEFVKRFYDWQHGILP